MSKSSQLDQEISHALAAYAEEKAKGAIVEAEVDAADAELKSFPRSAAGLVSDEVATSPEYRAAKTRFRLAFEKLRQFNSTFTKKFAKEIRAERSIRYSSK